MFRSVGPTTVNGQRGNPVVLSHALKDLIKGLSGDTGAGPILRGRTDVMECPVDDPAILQDVDTNDDLGHHLLRISQAQVMD
jgi:molybdenum cofactor cytidylyltransferase